MAEIGENEPSPRTELDLVTEEELSRHLMSYKLRLCFESLRIDKEAWGGQTRGMNPGPCRRHFLGGLLVAAGFLAPLLASPLLATETALTVNRGVEVPKVWTAARHVYVKGRPGVSRQKLDQLEKWMDANAPNWTVVLMEDAGGESFTDAGGQSFRGMDAVEHALGKTLPNQTAFGELKHPGTGEANGAYFILFLRERKFSYFGSEVYDRRGLGESRWIGNLDAPAIRAMRGGGRIVDAARDTITSIDRQLARKIAAEKAARQRAAEEARRQREEAAALVKAAENDIRFAAEKTADLRRELGNPAGDLARPPTVRWKQEVAAASRLLQQDQPAAGKAARETRRQVARYLSQVDAHHRGTARLAATATAIEQTRIHDESVLAATRLEEARSALERAQDAHARADSEFIAELDAAEIRLAEAGAASRRTERELVRLANLEERLANLEIHPRSTGAREARARAGAALVAAREAHHRGEPDFSPSLEAAARQLAVAAHESVRTRQKLARTRTGIIT